MFFAHLEVHVVFVDVVIAVTLFLISGIFIVVVNNVVMVLLLFPIGLLLFLADVVVIVLPSSSCLWFWIY